MPRDESSTHLHALPREASAGGPRPPESEVRIPRALRQDVTRRIMGDIAGLLLDADSPAAQRA